MKKSVLLIAVALVGSMSTFAQVKFGVKAGLNLSGATAKADDKKVEGLKSATGFHIGGIADISLAENFSLQPGLIYSQKGFKFEEPFDGPGSQTVTMTSKMSYIEVPVNFLYRANLGSGKIFGGVGPYFAYGIGGKVKFAGLGPIGDLPGMDDYFSNRKIKFDGKKLSETATAEEEKEYFKNDHYKGFDAGANVMIGYELKFGLFFTANYSLGLTNGAVEDKASYKNKSFGISVGYMFGGK
ncbi:porin family protein [Chitinophaga solisilvae]|uniref:PorT family protein n=1 Tax=Chitinophaga solisilvae TaxID=1233460 RepID=A0A433WCB5_9BACT|nr:porin family protein [Chitinophaga solisilvae]NSL89561.1 PorT family protein [Chitinophaga solisilvae]